MNIKNNFRQWPAFVFLVLCLALPAAQEKSAADFLQVPAKVVVRGSKPLPGPLVVTFFGNCGFLVQAGGNKVLFDLESPDKASDKAASGEAYRLLAEAAPPFDGLVTVLISHPHPDHIGIKEMAACLEKNRNLKLYSTAAAWDELQKAGASPSWLGQRVFVVAPGESRSLNMILNGMEVEFLELLHAGAPDYVFMDLCFVVTLGGMRVFYLSDVDPGFEKNRVILEQWSGKNERIDLLFSPDANLYETPWSTAGAETIGRLIRPERVVAMHLDPRAVDQAASKVKENFPAAIVFRSAGSAVEFR